jgi:hypothetical protein
MALTFLPRPGVERPPRRKIVTSDEAIEILKNLKELAPPNGVETWLPYLVRTQTAGLITAEERSAILGILIYQHTATKIAKID